MRADHQRQPGEGGERRGEAGDAEPLDAERSGGEPGEQRIGEISEDRERNLHHLDCLEQEEDVAGEEDANEQREIARRRGQRHRPGAADPGAELGVEREPQHQERQADQAAEQRHGEHVGVRMQRHLGGDVGEAERDGGDEDGRDGGEADRPGGMGGRW
jgi:hypothetical protein